jgi:iron complex outermembrane recepter protein
MFLNCLLLIAYWLLISQYSAVLKLIYLILIPFKLNKLILSLINSLNFNSLNFNYLNFKGLISPSFNSISFVSNLRLLCTVPSGRHICSRRFQSAGQSFDAFVCHVVITFSVYMSSLRDKVPNCGIATRRLKSAVTNMPSLRDVEILLNNRKSIQLRLNRGFFTFRFSFPPLLLFVFHFSLFTLSPLSIFAQNAVNQPVAPSFDTIKTVDLQQVTVTATMATTTTPVTFTNLSKEQIRRSDFGQDIPYLLKTTPSVVETSDAGAGIGYTGLRIRGSDATRTNVTIDGIPLNDAEGQGVYWVDLPDLSASSSMIQIQRGVGTSTNGAGAFGATINLITNGLRPEKYFNYTGGIGSFGTLRNAISAGTGLMNHKFAVDMKLSSITSNGYVDRAASNLQSLYLSGLYLFKNGSLKAKLMTGKEKTYQSWYGIPSVYLDSLRTFNPAGTEKSDSPYANQTDNYQQTHVHLVYNQQFTPNWRGNISAHYTKGKGYYEEYKASQKLKTYSELLPKDTTDLVRQLWLDNDFYGAVFSAIYEKKGLEWTTGGSWNEYDGNHFGKVIWYKNYNPKTPNINNAEFYRSTSNKTDVNIYSKLNAPITAQLNGFIDLQLRAINYTTLGIDRKKRDISRNKNYVFFNPKFGLNYVSTEGAKLYASFAIANREPNRNDLIDAEIAYLPVSERLYNTEIGWRKTTENANFGVNFYHMQYKNQLAVTGAINDVGEQIRANVADSYRAGIELEAAFKLSNQLIVNSNATFSQNKIRNFTENIDNWDKGGQDVFNRGTTDLALSPNAILNLELRYSILKNDKSELSFTPSVKYVGKQFLDNSSNENTILNAFNYTNFQLFYATKLTNNKAIKSLTIKLLIANVFNQKYVNNGWTYRFTSPSYDPRPDDNYARSEGKNVYNLSGFFPQAGRYYSLGASIDF